MVIEAVLIPLVHCPLLWKILDIVIFTSLPVLLGGLLGVTGRGPVSYTHLDVYKRQVLSFRCRPVNGIVSDHEELVDAIAARDRERAAETARRHTSS